MLPCALPPTEVLSPLFSAASAARSITPRGEGRTSARRTEYCTCTIAVLR